ncbi:MAG TPA: hypothetical protein VGP97_25560 [Burkholderiales bacterium]|nr:hypothetical protein [Burkholderiales bacterium]
MSLLWRNHLRISLCAERLVLAAYERGLRPGKGKPSVTPVQGNPNDPEWRPALDALPAALAGFGGHDVSVVLADQFVRYALLPWNAALKSAEQWLALARHRLGAVHGAAAADWDVKLTETAPSGPRLACALDRELLAELAAKLLAANVRLVSVQPFLVAAFNRIRQAIGNGSCWLVVEEPRRLTLAFVQRGVWVAVRSRRADAGWRAALPELIQRESAFLALSEPCTRVIVCAQDGFDPERHEAFRTEAVHYGELALAWEQA